MKTTDIKNLKNNLPKSPSIMGKEEFYNTAVLVPLVQKEDQIHLLFEERASNIRQGGEICFPGGFYQKEIDKDFSHTAVRETTEELGVDSSCIQLLGPMDTFLAPMGVTVDPFVGILDIDDINELNIENQEVARVFLLPVSYFQTHPPEIYQIKLKAHPYEIKADGQTEILLPSEKLGLPKIYHEPWGGVPLNVYVYHTPEAMIWGLTARILYYLIQMIT